MKNRIFSGEPSEDFAGYARAVIDGDTVYVSGTMGRGSDGVMPADVATQTRNALASIDHTLGQAGLSLSNAVICRVYITEATFLPAVGRVLGEVFADIRPANTLLVCQLPAQGALVEIEITASRNSA